MAVPTAENAKLEYEAGQTLATYEAMTDSGDQLTFTSSGSLWSRRSGYEPTVRPNGLITGGVVTPEASVTDNQVDVAALTCYLLGESVTVSAAPDTAITRAATDVASISSITVTAGEAIAVVQGTDSADATFSETRAAAGGPPLIPVGSIEIAQVRTTTNVAGAITAAEIFQVVGTHLERWDFPLWDDIYKSGSVTFLSALPAVHTGPVPKRVYATFNTPIFAQVSLASEFIPPETTHSVSSTQVYGSTVGSSSSSLNQGSFAAFQQDGVTDPLVGLKNEILWFRFYPDVYKAPYLLTQGKLGISRTFPAAAGLSASCTISADEAPTEVAA